MLIGDIAWRQRSVLELIPRNIVCKVFQLKNPGIKTREALSDYAQNI